MTSFWRNFFEAAAAVGFIVLGTVIVHLVMMVVGISCNASLIRGYPNC
jgi:hypothetical protein